jgi:SAM-dependent methyltransferase
MIWRLPYQQSSIEGFVTRMNCLICQSQAIHPHLQQSGYQVFRCASCGFQFVAPTPSREELAAYYDRAYAVPLTRYRSHLTRHNRLIADLERWVPQRGKLLEVGASYGHSLAIARARGWQVHGIELSPGAAQYANEQLRVAVLNTDLLDAPLPAASFDAIMLWHVLEHTREPAEQVARLYSLLKPGGILALLVPNINSVGARLAGRAWPWMCPPAHLWYFSPTTLPRLLTQHGFLVLEVTTRRGDGNNPYQHAVVAVGTVLNGLRRRWQSRRTTPVALVSAQAPSALERPTTDTPSALIQRWQQLLSQAQPITDGMAELSAPLLRWLEDAGFGDELCCYAQRPA